MEILFRGKKSDGGEWVYGGLLYHKDDNFIVKQISFGSNENKCQVFQSYRVIKETVGQYTGLKDKNGTKIFNGDNITYPSLHEDHSNAQEMFHVEPQCSWDTHEVYIEKKAGFIDFINGSFCVNNQPISEIIDGESMFNRISDLSYMGCIEFGIKELIRCEKEDWEVKRFKNIAKEIEIIGNIHNRE